MSLPKQIPLTEPHVAGNEEKYVAECLKTPFLSSAGPFLDRFESQFAEYVAGPYAVGCASGTAALHLALRLLNVGPGDEVWVTAMSFIASVNPIVYQGATPVFFDVEPQSWNMNPDLVAETLAARVRQRRPLPKALILVHNLGFPADAESIIGQCERHGVPVIEDAAESLGARWRGGRFSDRHTGTAGVFGCFSFNGNKIITSGGGGMLVASNKKHAERARHLATQARCPGNAYLHDAVGFNYRLGNIAAAVGLAQLEQLDGFLKKKQAIAERYQRAFRDMSAIGSPRAHDWAQPNHWLYTVMLEPGAYPSGPRGLAAALARARIESRPTWVPLFRQPMFTDYPRVGGDVADAIAAQSLSLPSSVGLPPRDQDRVIRTIAATLGGQV